MDAVRWHALSLPQQMGNIAARSRERVTGRDSAREGARDAAIERALELIDLTLTIPADARGFGKSPLGEVVRAWYVGSDAYDVSTEALQAYCTSFVLHSAATGKA